MLQRFMNLLTVSKDKEKNNKALTYRVVLGALFSLVAKADGEVAEVELKAKQKILAKRGYTKAEEQKEILEAAALALKESLDCESFTREVNQVCDYADRVKLVTDLFRIAWADHELLHVEIETIRRISNLLWVTQSDFIQAKLEARPEKL